MNINNIALFCRTSDKNVTNVNNYQLASDECAVYEESCNTIYVYQYKDRIFKNKGGLKTYKLFTAKEFKSFIKEAWVSEFPEDFIEQYKIRWNIED